MHTNTNMHQIHKKVDEIENGLLRFQHDNKQVSIHVKVKSNGVDSIQCECSDRTDVQKLVAGKVSLIQKSDKNYLYISGEIEKLPPGNKKIFSIHVTRACWFILKSKGSVSWLQEKCVYDISEVDALELAS